MSSEELKRRIGELCDRVMREDDQMVLLALMQELDALVDAYITNAEYENPPPSNEAVVLNSLLLTPLERRKRMNEPKKPFIMQSKPPQTVRSYMVNVYVDHEWVSNGMRFANEDEAVRYAEDLSASWVKVEHYDVQPSNDQPNAQMLRFGKHEKAKDEQGPEGA